MIRVRRVDSATIVGVPFRIVDLRDAAPLSIEGVLDAVLPERNRLDAPVGTGPARFLGDDRVFMLAAYEGDDAVGLAWGAHVTQPTGRQMTYLHELDVVTTHRRRGIATALVGESMVLARRVGSQRFWLSTGGHNETAQALYERLGGERKPRGDVNYWWSLD